MRETFTEDERGLLAPFVSNFDSGVFVLRNLPEVVKGALFSRYSRSTKSLRRTLLDEFIKSDIGFADVAGNQAKADDAIATEKAEKFVSTKPMGAWVPGGVVHNPVYFRRVDRPIMWVVIALTSEYAGKMRITPLPPGFRL